MPELRKDAIIERWVLIAPERSQRPHDVVPEAAPESSSAADACPFCEHRESMTTNEVLAYRDDLDETANGPGWRVRVVPNKYPAICPAGTIDNGLEQSVSADNIFTTTLPGHGRHEVIIESPEHYTRFSQLTDSQVVDILRAYRDRLAAIREEGESTAVMLFKNMGARAGASLEHLHSQLIAMPVVPIQLAEEVAAAKTYLQRTDRCIFCDLIAHETAEKTRLLVETEHFTAFCPYASRMPGETWIVPRRHAPSFDSISSSEIADLASLMRQILTSIETFLDIPAYNYVIHTSPFDKSGGNHYHWHIEIMPAVSHLAGFELGGGFYINALTPEDAADILRTQIVRLT